MESLRTYPCYAEVILPLALPKLYTYAVPESLSGQVKPGMRVEVQFGRQKRYTAIVYKLHHISPADYTPKEILALTDEESIVTERQLHFWEWIAAYYMCSLGEVMQAALPAAFKLDSETFFLRNPEMELLPESLSDDEYLVAEALHNRESVSLDDVTKILQRKTVSRVLRSLLEKKVIYLKESLKEKYTPKTDTFVEPDAALEARESLKEVFDQLSRYPKQEALLLAFFEMSKGGKAVRRAALLRRAQAGMSSLESLLKKGIFKLEEREVDRIAVAEGESVQEVLLTPEQQAAVQQISTHWQDKEVVLLHGITSSGKTMLYVELIKEQLEKGKQVLYLLPEIALTAQLIRRLEKVLGPVGVYHSKFNNAERVEIWQKVLSNELRVILGARSSLFLPFRDLGLIIVDEEHDTSYKQYDPSPRYQCRDAAVYLAMQFGAKVLLGSATPSIESYANARSGKYGLVKLANRYGDIQLPEIQFISLNDAYKKKEITSGITYILREGIQAALDKKEQVILFQNRRGYAPYLACASCNWIPMCRNCDVSLTYHKFTNDLRCHYCGYTTSLVHTCAACGSHDLQQRGLGTERIEEDLKLMFPQARIGRMDYDTVRSKHGHDKMISAFEEGEFDILVGTQMVTKGLDFGKVSLVGVLNADALLYYPDFRAMERAYQMLLQVSGRAGRRDIRGKVFIQIGNVHHVIADMLLQGTYDDFYQQQLKERKEFHYPPYSRLIQLSIKHTDIKVTIEAANRIADYLHAKYAGFIVGPNAPIIQKINNLYLRDILVKIPRQYHDLNKIKQDIQQSINGLCQFQRFKQVRVVVDVDCY